MTNSTSPEIDHALAELRSRRLAKESAIRTEQANALAKYRARAAADRRDLLAKFDRMDRTVADVQHRITVLEKQASPDALQRTPPALASWSAERLAATIAAMPADELAKLRQS